MRQFVSITICVSLCWASNAFADPIPLLNADFESNSGTNVGDPLDGWMPNGGIADHATFARPNNGTLGAFFGFYSAGTTETVGQLTGEVYQPNLIYTFRGWANGGGDFVGTVPFQLGYAATDDDLSSFVELATTTYDVGEPWADLAGVTYATGAAGPEIGRQLIVRFGDGAAGGASDIWFDNLSASVVPEPASMVLAILGATALLRRRRR